MAFHPVRLQPMIFTILAQLTETIKKSIWTPPYHLYSHQLEGGQSYTGLQEEGGCQPSEELSVNLSSADSGHQIWADAHGAARLFPHCAHAYKPDGTGTLDVGAISVTPYFNNNNNT